MNTIILIKLIAAHLTGDFILQSDRMCIDKFSNNSKAKYKALILSCLGSGCFGIYFRCSMELLDCTGSDWRQPFRNRSGQNNEQEDRPYRSCLGPACTFLRHNWPVVVRFCKYASI